MLLFFDDNADDNGDDDDDNLLVFFSCSLFICDSYLLLPIFQPVLYV